MEYFRAKLGYVDVWKVTHSGGQTKAGVFGQVTTNDGSSVAEQRQSVLDVQRLRAINQEHALALVTVNRSRYGDIIRVPQVTNDECA